MREERKMVSQDGDPSIAGVKESYIMQFLFVLSLVHLVRAPLYNGEYHKWRIANYSRYNYRSP
eukprot:scaffold139939_cov23-Tisochrysis_lutea.AAC.1